MGTTDDEEKELNMLIKLPARNIMRFVGKSLRIFRHEVLWYTRYLPGVESDMVRDMCPTCYLGYFEDDHPALDSKSCWPYMCAGAFGKVERGILIMEDLTKAERPYCLMEKRVVPTVEDVDLVMNMLAHFHGFWWRFLNCSTGMGLVDYLRQR